MLNFKGGTGSYLSAEEGPNTFWEHLAQHVVFYFLTSGFDWNQSRISRTSWRRWCSVMKLPVMTLAMCCIISCILKKGSVHVPLYILVYQNCIPAPSKGCCLNPKGWCIGTPYHPFSTPWKIQVCKIFFVEKTKSRAVSAVFQVGRLCSQELDQILNSLLGGSSHLVSSYSYHGDRKSPNWGCSPSKWLKWLINGGY